MSLRIRKDWDGVLNFTHGRSDQGNLACAFGPRNAGVWDEVEVAGDLYRIVNYGDLGDGDMERLDKLELACATKRGFVRAGPEWNQRWERAGSVNVD